MIARLLLLVVAVTAVATTASGGRTADDGVPPPLAGVPLTDTAGLQIVAASNPPLVVDVDTGRVGRVHGLDVRGNPVLTVLGAGDAAIVWLERRTVRRSVPKAEISVVPNGTDRATKIGSAAEVAPSGNGAGVWLKTHLDRYRCTLREIALDGSPRRSPRSVPCVTRLVNAGGRALLHRGEVIVDPATRRVVARAPRLLALAGDILVTATGQSGSLGLTDVRTGSTRSLDYPSAIHGQGGFGEALVDPTGTLVALEFGDPAYQLSSTQVMDLWLLDTNAGSLRQLPDMPAAVSLKRTSMSWTADGRLVLLAEVENRSLVAVWRPGDERLAVRSLRLPERTSGSDAIVAR